MFFFHQCDTPQYISQMKFDLHKTFSICQDWSSELISNVCWHVLAHMHAQGMETCKQHGAVNKPHYFSYTTV